MTPFLRAALWIVGGLLLTVWLGAVIVAIVGTVRCLIIGGLSGPC